MSKLAYFSITLVGAIPGAGLGYLLVMHLLDKGFSGPPIVVGVLFTSLACMLALVLMPLGVLVGYKSPNTGAPKAAAPATVEEKADEQQDAKPAKGKKGKDEAFDDAIPDDFDENELNESADDAFDAGDDDFEYEDDEFEEEEEQPKKKKKK